MSKPTVVFIAGERQHAGKTVASLGIISALCKHIDPADIGYFKPVGQELIELSNGERIDKDVLVVKEFTDLDMQERSILSPVLLGAGVTKEYVLSNNPKERTATFERSVFETMEHLSDKRVIIAEGTGHPGVGSVVGMSNAHVSKLLNAKILYLVGGGIGRTVDELEVDLSYFAHHHCHVAGVLFNKLLPKKVEMMKEVLQQPVLDRMFPEWDPSLNIFGYMPKVKYLNNPSMKLIGSSFKNCRMVGGLDENAWHQACRKVIVVSQGLEAFCPEEHLKPRDIAVIGAGSHRRLKRIVNFNSKMPGEKLGGIILTCATEKMPDANILEWLSQSSIPCILVQQDTADTDKIIYKCFSNTKLQLYDKKKHARIIKLFEENFDTERFIRTYNL